MAAVGGADIRPYGTGIDLGVEPPIEVLGRRPLVPDRRTLSIRWLCAIVLTGISGTGLIGVTIFTALDGRWTLARPPEVVTGSRQEREATAGLKRGDRLIRPVDVVAEKQTFKVPVSVKVGDKQVLRSRGFTHVATTLALAHTQLADDIPEFNPLKLLAGDAQFADPGPAEPGSAALADADVSFTTRDLATALDEPFGGALSADEIAAQVNEFARAPTAGRPSLPAQLLLMRTSRAGRLPTDGIGFAGPAPANFSSIEVKMTPENVTQWSRTEPPRDAPPQERLIVFRHGDSLDDVLQANGASPSQARLILRAFGARSGTQPVSEGRRLKLFFSRIDDGRPQIARISVYADENLETTIALSDNGDYVQVARAEPAAKPAPAPSTDEDTGGIRLYDSFYETALKQNIPKPIIENLLRIFANDIDFQRSVAGGDSFDAFYSEPDETDTRAELLYASITVRNEIYRYYRFQTPDDGMLDYYDENGRSVRKFLMRSPVPSAQLTSGFGIRFHPILGYSRPHTGVDWAAPIGTPILAAGSGTVLSAHPESGYGNRVEIQHANGYITTYSHMSGFARGIADGVKVRQGQVVGYLGQTGLATGPHLHYEVIVNGHFVDPMRVKLARTREIDGRLLVDFRKERDRIDTLMASAPNAVATDKRAAN